VGRVRVLVVSAPLLGHLLPIVPLARALAAGGHEVLLASGGDALTGPDPGLPTADVAPGFRFDRIARRIMLRHPLIARAELAGTGGTRGVSLLFGAVNDELADGVVALADRWSPDLVVYEPLAAAGALAAARLGVPAVRHENSLFDGAELVRGTASRLVATFRRHGVDTLPADAAVLAVAPPSVVGGRTGWPLRCVPYSGAGTLPDWLRERPGRPRIVVSRSTVPGPGGGGLMDAVVAAADAVDAEFVLVRPDRSGTRRDTLPANVRTVDWVPLADLLPTCAGVVHHGGAGTVLGALASGVPQLVVPGPGDRRHNAQLIADRGAGLARSAKAITAADLTRLVTDPEIAAVATQVREEIAAMPAPERLVDRLESLVRT
jgi:UDP:flavonoid glycosyltransferase YjiC (YdhE family)